MWVMEVTEELVEPMTHTIRNTYVNFGLYSIDIYQFIYGVHSLEYPRTVF